MPASWYQKEESVLIWPFNQESRPRTIRIGKITEESGFLDVEAARIAQYRNYWRQLIASDPAMDGT